MSSRALAAQPPSPLAAKHQQLQRVPHPAHGHAASLSSSEPAAQSPAGPHSAASDPSSAGAFNLRPQMPSAAVSSQPSSQQSFTMSQPSQSGVAAGFRSFGDAGAAGARGVAHEVPQIYTAMYSGVDVYEMEVNGIAVMRRWTDGWLNATQILKVAGVEKAKRTKILEKEIQTGEHEKVQGGYGKYQGTWIKFDRGVEVCRQYGVEDALHALLTYNTGQDGSAAGRGDINTPTKEQAMAAQRKKMYSGGGADARANGMSGTFFKSISSTASHAVAAISKARFDSPAPRNRGQANRPPSFSRQSSTAQNGDEFPPNSQQSYVSDYSQHVDPTFSAQENAMLGNSNEPPRKRQRVITPADSFGYGSQPTLAYNGDPFPGSPTEPNDSFILSQQSAPSGEPVVHDGMTALAPLPFEVSPEAEKKRSQLTNLFMDSNVMEQAMVETLRTCTPQELDMPIDSSSHTALHWAATLSRMPLLRALVVAGANPFRVNAGGETPLMRACVVTNSMDLGSFPDLLDVLGSTLEVRDNRGRTVLHHIALTSAVKGRSAASRYYLNSLLEWVVRQGSSIPSSQSTAANGNGVNGSQMLPPKMLLGRFMGEIVNARDRAGDTALNIAARIGNRSIVSQLLEVGADPNIANRSGLRPIDFGIGGESAAGNGANGENTSDPNGASSSQRSKESSDDIATSISNLLNETSSSYAAEMQAKQLSLDQLHASLRTTTATVGEARRALDAAVQAAKSQQLARQQTANLTSAAEEEKHRLLQLGQAKAQANGAANGINPMASNAAAEQAALAWETSLGQLVGTTDLATAVQLLPKVTPLRARIKAMRARIDATQKATAQLKSQGKDVELKYRRVVALSTIVPEKDVENVIDNLLRAVESEKGEVDLTRIRRFLGGVAEGVVL